MTEEQTVLLSDWQAAAEALAAARDREMMLRKTAMAEFFPDAKVGTNTLDLANGWKLKGVHKLNYSYDDNVDLVLEAFRVRFAKETDLLVRIKKEPVMTEIKKLTTEERLVLEQTLITKPGSPTLELVPPKEKKK